MMKFIVLNIFIFILANHCASAAESPVRRVRMKKSCQAALVALPRFHLKIDGLSLWILQGPTDDGEVPSIIDFYLSYNPKRFWPGSFYRLLFGEKPLECGIKDVLTSGFQNVPFLLQYLHGDTSQKPDEILTIRLRYPSSIPDTSYSMELLISRTDGKVFGRGNNVNLSWATIRDWMLRRDYDQKSQKGSWDYVENRDGWREANPIEIR